VEPSEVSAAHNSTGSTTVTELHINKMQPSTTHSFFERGLIDLLILGSKQTKQVPIPESVLISAMKTQYKR
jgi:hypothetical protein